MTAQGIQGHSRPLRPMTVGDVLDTAFGLYRRNLVLFASVIAVLAVPQNVLFALIGPVSGASASAGVQILTTLVTPVVALAGWGLIVGGSAHVVTARFLGQPISVKEAYARIHLRHLVLLVLSAGLAGVAIFYGLFFFLVPGILFFCRFAFIPQAVMLEGKGLFESWNRSWFLVRGSTWRVFVVVAAVAVIYSLLLGAGAGLTAVLGSVGTPPAILSDLLGIIWVTALEVLLLPVPLAALTLMYYDLRIRKEGFDLEVQAQSM